MSIWHRDYSLQELNDSRRETLDNHIGIRFVEISADTLAATMPVDQRTHQQLGIMHGGASCVLAETVGSVAANLVVDRAYFYCVGLSINTNHIRSIKQGTVRGCAKAQHLGRSTQVWNIQIHDEQQRLISTTQLTMAVLMKKREGH